MTTVQDEISLAEAKAEILAGLREAFSDLTLETNRWGRVFRCSKRANSLATTDYEITYSCGCCPNPAFYVRLFVDTPYGRVYGVPHQILLGERTWNHIDCPGVNWEEVLRHRGAPEHILEKLRAHFADQAQRAAAREKDGE